MMQLTGDFQAWECSGIFTNSKRQCLECNRTEKYNHSKLVFTELGDVYRFIGGREAKLKFHFWTVAFWNVQVFRALSHRGWLWASEIMPGFWKCDLNIGLCVKQRRSFKNQSLRETQMGKKWWKLSLRRNHKALGGPMRMERFRRGGCNVTDQSYFRRFKFQYNSSFSVRRYLMNLH